MHAAIAKEHLQAINGLLNTHQTRHHGFLGGTLGLLYYYFYASEAFQDEPMNDKAHTLLEQVFDDLNSGKGLLYGHDFNKGAAGLGYVVRKLQLNRFLSFDMAPEFEHIDAFIYERAMEQMARNDNDYLHGAMGAVHYFTARGQEPAMTQRISDLVQAFCQKACTRPEGVYFLNYSLERLAGKGADLGLAHGLTGNLLLLLNALPFLREKEQAAHIIREGIRLLLHLEQPVRNAEDEYSFLPFSLKPEDGSTERLDRLAWCYGDLGCVLLLYRAGKYFGDNHYIQTADRIGLASLLRKTADNTMSDDSMFCHGHSGLAQLYKSLYTASGHTAYLDAYKYWVGQTLDSVTDEMARNKYAANPCGLLEGWTGIAFVLTEYVHGQPMDWAEAFLL